jgi:pyruvate dehydrogenase E2 component (dihydrolipoamide acetyltransferase)
MTSKPLILPELGMDDQPIVLSLWLVKEGTRVAAGEPVVEILVGPATVDLDAPADGILAKKLSATGDVLTTGQLLAVIEETA